jgi:mono/diheme cytochrome c family protein
MPIRLVSVISVTVLALAFLMAAEGVPAQERPSASAAAAEPSRSELQARAGAIFKNSCAVSGCHTGKRPSAKLSLDPQRLPGSVKNVQSREIRALRIVDTANPAKSYMLMKLRGAKGIKGDRMPRVGPALKEHEIKTITQWIEGLAADERGAGGMPLSDELAEGENGTHGPFLAQTLINLPTTESLDAGKFLFRVSHRFYTRVAEGHEYLYGLDGPAFVFVSLAYGVSDRWGVALGRTNLRDEVELSSRFSLFREESGRIPFSASLAAAACLTTEVPEGEDVFDSRNLRGSLQLSLSRALCDRVSALVVPSYSYNTDYSRPKEESTFAAGLGGRLVLSENVSLVGEFIPVFSGYSLDASTWGAALEVKKGGHVFHLFVNDSYGLTPSQYLPGGDLELSKGDVRLGFNIYRTL